MKKIFIVFILFVNFFLSNTAEAGQHSLSTKINKNICKDIKQKYKLDSVSLWPSGLSSDQDVLKEINSNISLLSNKQKKSTGKLKIIINNWIIAENNTKKSINNKDITLIINSITSKIDNVNKFNKFCEKIEKKI